MEDNITNPNSETITRSKYRLLLEMWVKPRNTIRYIIQTNPTQFVLIIAMLSGIFQVLGNFAQKGYGDYISLLNMYLISIIAGPVLGLISFYLFGALLNWTGKWIGGTADSEKIRAAYAWGLVPYITLKLVLVIPEILFFGNDIYRSDMTLVLESTLLMVLFVFTVLLEIIGWIWTTIILLKALGEVQGFSAWKALGNVLLAFLVIFIALFLFILVIY